MSTGVGKQVADENVETGDPVANKDADSVTNNDAQDVQPTEPQPSVSAMRNNKQNKMLEYVCCRKIQITRKVVSRQNTMK